MQLSASNIFRSPVSALLEYSGLLRGRSSPHSDSDLLLDSGLSHAFRDHHHHYQSRLEDSSGAAAPSASSGAGGAGGEVSIRIITAAEQDTPLPTPPAVTSMREVNPQNPVFLQPISRTGSAVSLDAQTNRGGLADGLAQSTNTSVDAESPDGAAPNTRDSSYQRYDIQQAARWIEQVLPFSLLLLVVFIRQHLQGITYCLTSCFILHYPWFYIDYFLVNRHFILFYPTTHRFFCCYMDCCCDVQVQ